MTYYWILIFALLLFTLLSGFCASSETAYFSIPTARAQLWRKSSNQKQRMVATLLAHSRQLLVLIFILNTIINVLIQNISSDLFDQIGGGWICKIAIPFALILIFGEFLPKYFGRLYSGPISLFAAPLYTKIGEFTAPIQKTITHLAELTARIVFFFLKPEPPLTPKEMIGVIETCETHTVLSTKEGALLRQSIEFERKSVRDIMIPRSEMVFIRHSQLSLHAIQDLWINRHELLLIDEELDHPLGALSSNEILLLQADRLSDALKDASSRIFFVPEVMSARKLLQEFFERKANIAIVVDEHSTISGFVEWEPFSKRIVHKHKEKTLGWNQKSITVSGSTSLETITTFFNVTIQSAYHSATIGGWVSEMLDEIPLPGASLVTPDLIFRVLKSDEKAIRQIFIQKRHTRK